MLIHRSDIGAIAFLKADMARSASHKGDPAISMHNDEMLKRLAHSVIVVHHHGWKMFQGFLDHNEGKSGVASAEIRQLLLRDAGIETACPENQAIKRRGFGEFINDIRLRIIRTEE
ncbi:hypothetical protein U14_03818 [Candidatus Moduliflexus flocculans]|uniref:Uncharacterized protein n=1 Tax=Candidatus Moduliflexus flocculans TaxID=1499966 RepID=A0A081BQA0_9BACT|nr:hypothetical protein U14_03818 [Candidatus Moduliflexus flocculans]